MPENQDRFQSVENRHFSVRQNYNRLSPWYDLIAGSTEARFWQMGLSMLNLRNGLRVLEIGSGTGQALLAIAEKVKPDGKVFGLDISSGMQARASKKIRVSAFREIIQQINGDALTPPFIENGFDAIIMSFTLELFSNREVHALLSNLRYLLNPKGQICVVSMADKKEHNLILRLYWWAHRHFPDIIDCRPIRTEELISTAGFKITRSQKAHTWGLPVDIITARLAQAST